MQVLVKTTNEISAAIAEILTAIKESTTIVVAEISNELANFSKVVSSAVSYSIVELLDEIFNLWSEDWVAAEYIITRLNNWMDVLIYDKISRINKIIINFDTFTNILIQRFTEQLAFIEESISEQYNQK
ncbi:unnamed protein product, partial [marine sediment metagenome]